MPASMHPPYGAVGSGMTDSDAMLEARLADQRCKDAERREAILKEKIVELEHLIAQPAKSGKEMSYKKKHRERGHKGMKKEHRDERESKDFFFKRKRKEKRSNMKKNERKCM